MDRTKRWDVDVTNVLTRRFAGNDPAFRWHHTLWKSHLSANFSDENLVADLKADKAGQFRQRIWEMAIGRHLLKCGHQACRGGEGEPDYYFHDGRTKFWVEAVFPLPSGNLAPNWLKFDRSDPHEGHVPHSEMALRWTSALSAKAEKCETYRNKGVVHPDDAFVIAIDVSQLARYPVLIGISQFPIVTEMAFGIGPLAISFDTSGRATGPALPSSQPFLAKMNNRTKLLVPVDKAIFALPQYRGVSAILSSCPSGEDRLSSYIAHNPYSNTPISKGLFGTSAQEWGAKIIRQCGDYMDWDVFQL